MRHRTKMAVVSKPAKPYDGFPLFAHSTARWAKKILGKTYYFGPWSDWEGSLENYQRQKDYLHAGKQPPALTPDGDTRALTLKDAVNEFLNAKRAMVDNAELSARHWLDYKYTAGRMLDTLGKSTPVEDLRPDDFLRLRAALAKGRGLISLKNEITRTRAILDFAYRNELTANPIRYGAGFTKPTADAIARERSKKRAKHGERMLTAAETRTLLDDAGPAMKAMILLALNSGCGQSDLASLPCSAVHDGWLDFPRVKNAQPRRVPLWPETLAALEDWSKQRPEPKSDEDADLVFVTKYGGRWVKVNPNTGTPDDAIGKEFAKLLKRHEIKRDGLNFYALRHTFATVALETGDRDAVKAVMGHSDRDVLGTYDERGPSDERRQRVVNHVRSWLLGGGSNG